MGEAFGFGGKEMDFTEKYTSDSEERLLLRRINELIKRSQREYRVLYSAFLTPPAFLL